FHSQVWSKLFRVGFQYLVGGDRMCQPVVDVQLYTANEVLAFTTKPGEQLGEDIKPLFYFVD
ncbi:MAG: hypothetical protein DRQ03_08320, partial [Candidatus Hydrothermota bacterium]